MKLVGTFTGILLNYAHIQFGAMGVSHNEVVSQAKILQQSQEIAASQSDTNSIHQLLFVPATWDGMLSFAAADICC